MGEKKLMRAKQETFIYFMPAKNYFIRLMSEIIAQRLHSNSKHIVIPVYGELFDESLESRYPKFLKRVQLRIVYWKRQFSLNKTLKTKLKFYLGNQQIKSVQFIPAAYFLLTSAIDHCLMQTKKEKLNSISDFEISDQVIDTYLRFKPSEKYIYNDSFVNDIWHRARSLNRLIKSYTSKRSGQKICISSYSSYIHEGVFTRQAVLSNCTLVTLGSTHSYYKIHNVSNGRKPSHMEDHNCYTIANAQELPDQVIKAAKNTLLNRAHGKYDNSMPYMKNSPKNDHENNLLASKICSGKVIMLLHDFFDAPHSYDWMLFTDFWTWATDTIEFCIKHQIPLVIKPHPNQINESAKVVEKLKNQFKTSGLVQWIPAEIPNSTIFHHKPLFILSVYGSVAAEAACFGLKVLLAGDHPGINFKIAHTALTKEDYWDCLRNPEKVINGSVEEAIYFTAIHNKNIFLNSNDALWTHEGIDDKTTETNPQQLLTESANQYVLEMTKKLLNDLEKNDI
ncbi:hypothetical protein [Synechococcus sp. MIT S9452]|uniref:hypothetical protein n=1 Tax=Synechococcus sp. MIT S9452 TaxID=3082546 RepID=UPI0039A6862E